MCENPIFLCFIILIGKKMFVNEQPLKNFIVDEKNNLTLLNFLDDQTSLYYNFVKDFADPESLRIILEYCGKGANCFSAADEIIFVSHEKRLVIGKKDLPAAFKLKINN